MPLEAVMVCVDNSEWMRNGDYLPSRMEAQREAVQYVSSSKLNSNPESTVGLLSMAGHRIEVHTSPSRAIGQIMNALTKQVNIGGNSNVVSALKTAQLALKNRPNKNQRQRVIVFVGSPIQASAEELERIGKMFKKNNVSVDVVNFGAENSSNENTEKLEALINAVNTSDQSHLVHVPPGPHLLSDLVMSSPIMGDGAASSGMGGGGGGGGDAGFDENADPEMAMAIRMSMEEARQREGPTAQTTAGATSETPAASAAATTDSAMSMDGDEDELLQQAIALSMQAETQAQTQTSTTSAAAMDTATSQSSTSQPSDESDLAAQLNDESFINSLLTSVPGVQPQPAQQPTQQGDNTTKDSKDKDAKKDSDKQ